MAQRSLIVNFIGDTAQLEAAIKRASGKIGGLQGVATKVGSAGASLTRGLTVPIVGVAVAAGKTAMDFDASMSKIKGLVGASQQQINTWSNQVLDLSKTLPQSPKELADALFFVTSAGFKGQQAMKVLTISAKAAAAGLGDTKTVADAVTSTLNAYHMKGSQAASVTDTLVAAVRSGKMPVEDLAGSIGSVLPIASEVGVKFSEVAGFAAALSRSGANVDRTMTGVRFLMTALVNPTSQAQKVFQQFGLSAAGIRKEMADKGLLSTLTDLKRKLPIQDFLKVTGGARGVAIGLGAVGKNAKQVAEVMKEVQNSSGATAHAFAVASHEAKFKLGSALSDVQVALVEIGNKVLPVVMPAIEQLAGFIAQAADSFSHLNPHLAHTIVEVGLAVAALGPLLTIAGKLISTIGRLWDVFKVIVLGPLRLAIQGVTAAFAFLTDGLLATRIGLAALWVQEKANTVATIASTIAQKAAAVATAVWAAAVRGAEIAQIAWNAVMDANPILLVVGALALLIPAIALVIDHWKKVEGILKAGWDWMKGAALAAFNAVKSVITTAWSAIKSVTETVWDAIKGFFKKWWPEIVGVVFGGGIGLLIALIVTHWNKAKQITSDVWNAIKGVLATVWNAIKGVFSMYLHDIATILGTAWKGIKAVAGLAWDGIKAAIVNPVGDAWKLLKGGVTDVTKWLAGAWKTIAKGVGAFAADIKNGVLSAIQGAINSVIDFLNKIIDVLDKLPFVNIGKIGKIKLVSGGSGAATGSKSTGGRHAGLARGGLIDRPMVMVGEEAPTHPEIVIASNPAYRSRNVGLWAQAGRHLGIPGFATGGVVGASEFGGPGDPTTPGNSGAYGTDVTGSIARLQSGGGWFNVLKPGSHWKLTASTGKSVDATVTDWGSGGGSVGGKPRAIDLWWQTANALGLPGSSGLWSGLLNVEPAGGGGGILGTILSTLSSAAGTVTGLASKAAGLALGVLPDPTKLLPSWLQHAGSWLIDHAKSWAEHEISTLGGLFGGGAGGAGGVPIAAQKIKTPSGLPPAIQKALQVAEYEVGRHIPYGSGQYGAYYGVNAPSMDCSGFVSTVLNAAGLDPAGHLLTGGLKNWGVPGDGKYLTVGVLGADSGPTGHTMMEIIGRYFESGGGAGGPHEDSGWSSNFPWHRHYPGLAKGGMIPSSLPGRIRPGDPGYQPTYDQLRAAQRSGLTFARGGRLPFAGEFADGGVVPGPRGAPALAVVHGGEEFSGVNGGSRGNVVVQGDLVVREEADVSRIASTLAWRLATS